MLDKFFDQEKIQLPCWIPIFIAIGILIGFNISPINNIILIFSIAILLIASFFSRLPKINLILISSCSIIIGILSLQLRVENVNSPIIPFEEKFTKITGNITNITPLEHGYKIIFNDIYINKLPLKETPHKIRLTVKTPLGDAKIGDRVKFNAILSKPMQQYLPDSYDFSRDAYFKQIGAVGYSVSKFKILKSKKKSFQDRINSLRNDIQIRVNDAIGPYNGSLATALMLNEYSNIDKEVLKDLRATGLAHILSVSGMHLSLVAAIFFFTSRFLLNCFEPMALRINCKKIAALISLVGSFGYLLISGMEVAAIRSFIMTAMIIISIIIDRTSTPMRAIALAASLILIISPENIIHPSFQMSFAAVLALIACFESFSKLKFDFNSFNIPQKILFYLLSLSFASLVAGLATMPFALYHFNQSSNYSILANLLAVPITSFWLMPCVVIAFLLYPFHLEILALYPMKFGIELMLNISHYISNLPYSVTAFAKMSDLNLLIIVIGMVWFCIWHTRIRFIGMILILCGIISQSFIKRPDIFIDWDQKIIAVLDQENRLIFLTKPLGKFKKQLLMNQLGSNIVLYYPPKRNKNLYCKKNICHFIKEHYKAVIDTQKPSIKIFKDNISQKLINSGTTTSLIFLERETNEE